MKKGSRKQKNRIKLLLLKNFQAVKEFEKSLNKTLKLITLLRNNITSAEAWINLILKKGKPSDYKKEMIKGLSMSTKEKTQIFEMGYITLFSHFEYFMYDLLKELFYKYPNSLNIDVAFEDIRDIKSVKKIREYIIDTAAVKKSYNIDAWLEMLKNVYGVNIFDDKLDQTRLNVLNEYRNILMHSGGKINVLFRKNMKKLIKLDAVVGEKYDIDMKEFFYILYNFLMTMLKNLKKL